MYNFMRFEDQAMLRLLQAQDRQMRAKAATEPTQAGLGQNARGEKLRRRQLARSFAQEEGLSFDDTPKRERELLRLREKRVRERARAADAEARRKRTEDAGAVAALYPGLAVEFDGSLEAADELLRAKSSGDAVTWDRIRMLSLIGVEGCRVVRRVQESTDRVGGGLWAAMFLSGALLVFDTVVGTVVDGSMLALLFAFFFILYAANLGRPDLAMARLVRSREESNSKRSTSYESVRKRGEVSAVRGSSDRPTAGSSSRRGIVHRCPIPGCEKVFEGSRRGWDSHVASARLHPGWQPEAIDGEDRKRLFREEFGVWFEVIPSAPVRVGPND